MIGATNKKALRERKRMESMVVYLQARADKLAIMFRGMDSDHNGSISRGEFKVLINQIDPKASLEDCEKLFNMVDGNSDGKIVFNEFVENLVCADFSSNLGKSMLGNHPRSSTFPAPSNRSRSVLGTVCQADAQPLDESRSQSALDGAVSRRSMQPPKLYHGSGSRAGVYDDGFLRTLVDGPPEKVWYDDRDWAKVRPPLTIGKTRFGADQHGAAASSASVGRYYKDTMGITKPVQGTPWASDGTEEWRRDCKQSWKEPIHCDLSHSKTFEQHARLHHARRNKMWHRLQEIEAKRIEVNEKRFGVYDARLASMQKQRARYYGEVERVEAENQKMMSHNGKMIVKAPASLEANGYNTMKCLQPGGIFQGEPLVPRMSGMNGPRGLFPL